MLLRCSFCYMNWNTSCTPKVVVLHFRKLVLVETQYQIQARVINFRLKYDGKLSLFFFLFFGFSIFFWHLELAKESPYHLHIQQLKVLHTFLYGLKKASFFRDLSLLWFKDTNTLITQCAKGMMMIRKKDVFWCNVSLGSKLRLKCFVFPLGR